MDYFPYGNIEINHLKSRDKILGDQIDKIGFINRAIDSDLFTSLVTSISSQQISTAAARTINGRLLAKAGQLTPQTLLALGVNEIQTCGLSIRKATYIYEICDKIMNDELDLEKIEKLSDEEAINELSKLRGIGRWTAEMLLMFSMLRKDILSYDDLAIHRGMRMLYQLEKIDKETFTYYRKLYSPYGSIASIYLWVISSGQFGHIDPKQKQSK